MVQGNSRYAQTHKLLELAEVCAEMNPYFGEPVTRQILTAFDLFDQVGRYRAVANFDPLAIQGDRFETAGMWTWTNEHLHKLDAFVFRVRSMLDFERIGFGDLLRSVLDRDRRSLLVGTWKGRIPLRVVLTRNNRHFRS